MLGKLSAPPKRVPSAALFFTLCRLTMQPPQSYSFGGQHSSGQLTGKPAGAQPDYRGRWCAKDERREEDEETAAAAAAKAAASLPYLPVGGGVVLQLWGAMAHFPWHLPHMAGGRDTDRGEEEEEAERKGGTVTREPEGEKAEAPQQPLHMLLRGTQGRRIRLRRQEVPARLQRPLEWPQPPPPLPECLEPLPLEELELPLPEWLPSPPVVPEGPPVVPEGPPAVPEGLPTVPEGSVSPLAVHKRMNPVTQL
ncbi:UNVERIFIED_CONTAM: hypothetical protein FKN15_059711 [Acipenser sinensis]